MVSSSDNHYSPVVIKGLSKNHLTNTNSGEVARVLIIRHAFLLCSGAISGTKDKIPNLTKDVPISHITWEITWVLRAVSQERG